MKVQQFLAAFGPAFPPASFEEKSASVPIGFMNKGLCRLQPWKWKTVFAI